MEIIIKVAIFCLWILALIVLAKIAYSFFGNAWRNRKLPPYVNSFWRQLWLLDKYNWKKWAKMLDLGCGDGGTLRYIYQKYGLTLWVWYDINTFAIRFGQIINYIYKIFGRKYNIQLHQADIYTANLKWRDYVYIYLFPDFMAEMEDWLWAGLDSGTMILANTFSFAKHEPIEVIKNEKWKIVRRIYKID